MEEKRFILSREDFAKERVSGLQRAVETIRRERPEVLSLALFGSLTKGTTKLESDIDMAVYVDADLLRDVHPDLGDDLFLDKKYDFNAIRNGRLQAVTFRWKDLRSDLSDEYERYVNEKILAAIPGLRKEQLKDVYIQPVSEKIVDGILEEIKESYQKYPNGIASSNIQLGGRQVWEGDWAKDQTPNSRVEPNQLLFGLFFLDAGGGLREYRKQIIDRLWLWGELGEQIWKDLISKTEMWEQRVDFDSLPTAKRYPRTLKAAHALYGRAIS